jgi:hypothetical protein
MTAEITYVAVYVLGVSAGIIFAILANGVEFRDFPWLQERDYTYKDDPKSPSMKHAVIRSGSHFISGILKK